MKAVPPIANGANEVRAEEPPVETEQTYEGDDQMYGNDQDGDDDIDFNLGGGNGGGGNGQDYGAPTPRENAHGPGIKEDG